MTTLVEGFAPDALALARFLAAEGETVRLAGPGSEPAAVRALRGAGVEIEPNADLDSDPGEADVAYLDVWTPEIAPRVARLRAQGTRISCLGDLLLERWPGTTIGITGTAGKTSTTSLVASILRAEGIDTAVSAGARAGNLWPTGDLLEALQRQDRDGQQVLLLELTSSHLAFMSHSPNIAAVVSFWPDHLELHGDLARYHAAKETIVRHQREGDAVVVNADDRSVEFASTRAGGVTEFSLRRSVDRGAYARSRPWRGSRRRVRRDAPRSGRPVGLRTRATSSRPSRSPPSPERARPRSSRESALSSALPWRAQPLGTHAGVAVVDDGMAATPMKTLATLSTYPDRSIVLIAGGLLDAGGGPVHATPEERALLERACDEIARVARLVVVFGDGGARLDPLLRRRRVETVVGGDLAEAAAVAVRHSDGAKAVVFSPLFPLSTRGQGSVRITGSPASAPTALTHPSFEGGGRRERPRKQANPPITAAGTQKGGDAAAWRSLPWEARWSRPPPPRPARVSRRSR